MGFLRRRRRRRDLARKKLGLALLGLAAVMLGATVFLGSLLVRQSQALQLNVAYTQDAVDANVRTLGQVQREMLRLQALLAAPPVNSQALDLQLAFVDQRVQEGALPVQIKTLGSDELLARSVQLANTWSTGVRSAVVNAVSAGDAAALTAAGQQVVALEKQYNALVSDGEINRRVRAGEANNQSKELLAQVRTLLVGLSVTLASFLLFTAVAGYAFWQLNRQRDAAGIQLQRLNRELSSKNADLRTHALVVHATDNLVVITDADGAIEWVNAAFERTTGHQLADIRGCRPGAVLQGPDTDPAAVQEMAEAFSRGVGFAVEVLNYTAAGGEYWVSIEAHPVHDDDGRLTHFIAIETDVTERRRTEESLRLATDTAVSLAQEKGAFLATMSHEIRTPLNAVLGVTELLSHTDLDPEQSEYVRTANNSGRLLLGLINDILDFSALESGRIEIERRRFSVADVVRQVEAMFATDASARGVELSHHIAPGVPEFVEADENRVKQVLLNLVGNGLKFTHEGHVRILVDAVHLNGELTLRIAIKDSGIGIPPGRQERIFLPFTQVDPSTTREYGGSGLGLSICRLIAKHLGGSLTVDSTPGRGSTFTFCIPVVEAMAALPVDGLVSSGQATATDRRVLVAEDDAINRMVVLRMLGRLGVRADVVEDGEQAVAAVAGGDYELILMDVHMPRLDGVAATAAIRQLEPAPTTRPWIVALTANALDGDREKLLDSGMDGYLSKPVTLSSLSDVLATIPAPVR